MKQQELVVVDFEDWVAEDPEWRSPEKWERIEDADGFVRFVRRDDTLVK